MPSARAIPGKARSGFPPAIAARQMLRIARRLAAAGLIGIALASARDVAMAGSGLPPLPAMGPSLRKAVAFETGERPGTIIIRKNEKALYLVTGQGISRNLSALRASPNFSGIAATTSVLPCTPFA